MIQITPVGLLVANVESSNDFYRNILAIECIQNLGKQSNMSILRLESPRIEVEEVYLLIKDRPRKNFSSRSQRLRLICNLDKTLEKLKKAGIETSEIMGCYQLNDLNGLEWQLSDGKKRSSAFLES